MSYIWYALNKNKYYFFIDKVLELEQENAALVNQIEEIAAQQIDRDRILDEFGIAIDARISEWKVLNKFNKRFILESKKSTLVKFAFIYKDILDEKDMEIASLKENLSQSLMKSVTSVKEENKSQIIHLNDEIMQRDTIIDELQTKLSEAVVEINKSAALIERLKGEAQE